MAWEKLSHCSKCGSERDGSHSSYCRACYRAYSAEWAKKNPEKVRAKQWRMDLKRSYGITPEQWHALLAEQGGRCAICETDEPGGRGNWHVDHDHSLTGAASVRGLLCTNCNVALGQAKDDPKILRKMAEYIEQGGYAAPAGGDVNG